MLSPKLRDGLEGGLPILALLPLLIRHEPITPFLRVLQVFSIPLAVLAARGPPKPALAQFRGSPSRPGLDTVPARLRDDAARGVAVAPDRRSLRDPRRLVRLRLRRMRRDRLI